MNSLIAATLFFVGCHFLLSSRPLREPLAERLGKLGFLAAYSIVALAAFIWMVKAYGAAPVIDVWLPPAALRWIPVVVMPIALILVVSGPTTPNPTAIGGERFASADGANPAPGIVSVTRHPGLWGIALWAFSHLLVNGDAASMILMAGILALCLGGMAHIDRRREATLGSAWGPVKLTTSVVPFAAILAGRSTFDWRGISWWRPLLGLAVYVALFHGHTWIAGVSLLPE